MCVCVLAMLSCFPAPPYALTLFNHFWAGLVLSQQLFSCSSITLLFIFHCTMSYRSTIGAQLRREKYQYHTMEFINKMKYLLVVFV